MLVISKQFEASVAISTYCMQPSLPKKTKGPNKSFIEDAAVLFGLDDNKDEEEEEEEEDNNEYFRNDFVVDHVAEEEEDKASTPRRRNDKLEDSDEDDNSDITKESKRQRLQCIER